MLQQDIFFNNLTLRQTLKVYILFTRRKNYFSETIYTGNEIFFVFFQIVINSIAFSSHQSYGSLKHYPPLKEKVNCG